MEKNPGMKKSFSIRIRCESCGIYMDDYSIRCEYCGWSSSEKHEKHNIESNESMIPIKSNPKYDDNQSDSDDVADVMIALKKPSDSEVAKYIDNNKSLSPKKVPVYEDLKGSDDSDDSDDSEDIYGVTRQNTTKYNTTKYNAKKYKTKKSTVINPEIIKKEMINEIFMTAIVNDLLQKYETKYKKYVIDENIVKKSLKRIIKHGSGINLVTIDGRKVTVENCDPEYQSVIECLYKWTNQQNKYYKRSGLVKDLCDKFVRQIFYPEFEKNLSEFYKTCTCSNYDNNKDKKEKNISDKRSISNEKYMSNEKKISNYDYIDSEEEYIKKQFKNTFYNAMKTECIFDMMIDNDDLMDRDPYIYLSLPSFGIMGMTECEDELSKSGIRLYEGRMIRSNECPKDYKIIFDTVIDIRDCVKKLDQNQRLLVKYKLVPEKTIPEDLENLLTPEIIEIVSIINSASIEISRLEFFKEDIENVIQEILILML